MDRIHTEKKYLEKVKTRIVEERQEQIELLEKIPWQFKGRYADVKWGDENLVDSLTKMSQNRLKELEKLENNPYFGSFDFESGIDGGAYYIGKTDILESGNVIVLDWRNPICTLYYEKSIGEVSYVSPGGTINGNLTRKSQILIKNGELEAVRDTDFISDDELLKPYLNVSANNRMRTIIASIQKEQNEIIRRSVNYNIIVQGVAGSGKTSVALHRIAYLIYALGNKYDSDSFAIIGPNKYFLNYVSSILPDLDTKSPTEYTFEEIAEEIIDNEKYTYESANDQIKKMLIYHENRDYSKKLKGDLRYKKALSQFLIDYFSMNLTEGVYFEDIELISAEKLKKSITPKIGYSKNIRDFIKEISKKQKEKSDDLYFQLSKNLMDKIRNCSMDSNERIELINKTDVLKKMIKSGCSDELKKIVKPLLISPIELYKLFIENIEKYINIENKELQILKTETIKQLSKKNILNEDLAAISYLSMIYNGFHVYDKFKQIIVDEAQDYSLFQFDILKSIFRNGKFSIFGDLAQSVYSYNSLESWSELNNQVFDDKCEILNINKSYRTTKEITDVANNILGKLDLAMAEPIARSGENVTFFELNDKEKETFYPKILLKMLEKEYNSIGIICKNDKEMEIVAKNLASKSIEFNLIKSSDVEYNAGISILSSYLAKGLEFDAIIINDASCNQYDVDSTLDMKLLYVALTRALHELVIIHNGDLVDVLKTKEFVKKISTKRI